MASTSSGSEGSETTVATSGERVLKKGPWTAAEDAILLEYVKKHGEGNWNAVQRNSGLSRCGKSCRLRWANHLRPNLKKGSFSPEEERLILELHAKLGNKWARMAAQMPGRTDNEIKNYWNTRIKRRQRAGLPLYPPDIQRSVGCSSTRGATPALSNDLAVAGRNPNVPSLDRIPFKFSLMPPSSPAPSMSPRAAFLLPEQQHRLKRLRESSMVNFGAPFLARPLQAVPPTQTLFPYSSVNYDLCSALVPQPHTQQFSMKMELPSNQLFVAAEPVPAAGGEWVRGNTSGLLDSLFHEGQPVNAVGGPVHGMREDALLQWNSSVEKRNWIGPSGAVGDGADGTGPPPPPESRLTPTLETPATTWNSANTERRMKGEGIGAIRGGGEEDLSALMDIMPSEQMATTSPPVNASNSNWYRGGNGEMTSNVPTSTMTSEVIGSEMQQQQQQQQVVSTNLTIGDEDRKWSTGTSDGSNPPGIC